MTTKTKLPDGIVLLDGRWVDVKLRDSIVARVQEYWRLVDQRQIYPTPGKIRPNAEALLSAANAAASYFPPPPGPKITGLHSPGLTSEQKDIVNTQLVSWGQDGHSVSEMGPRRS